MDKVTNYSQMYHLFNLETYETIDVFYSLNELIDFLSKYQDAGNHYCDSKYNNNFLDNLNVTLEDKKSCYLYYYNDEYGTDYDDELKEYIVVDGYNRIVDVRLYSKEILERSNYVRQTSDFRHLRYFKDSYIRRIRKYVGEGYKGAVYRRDPMPFIRNSRKYYPLRCMKTTNERRQNSDKEIEKYVRPKRKSSSLPNCYDDIYRHNDRCWKTQSKKRKQWMKK